MGGGGDEVRRSRRNVNQNLGRAYCWATCLETGEPCTEKVPENTNVPYCPRHLNSGDDALLILDHPTNKGIGKILVARRDLPKGYKMVYWGKRCRWRGCKGEDRAMSFLQNGGVIDPSECEGQQLQYMACPGPGERCNTKCTDVCFGKTYDTRLIGREFETSEPIKKNHQLLQWYGSKDWFDSRDIPRTNVGTAEYPAPQRRKSATAGAAGAKKRKQLQEIDLNAAAAAADKTKPKPPKKSKAGSALATAAPTVTAAK